jgi:hypothetical protein
LRRAAVCGSDRFLSQIPIVYLLTVVGYSWSGSFALRGLFIGDDIECFIAPPN